MTRCVRVIFIVATVLAVAAVPAVSVHAQDDWPAWGREASNQRHSPLTVSYTHLTLPTKA